MDLQTEIEHLNNRRIELIAIGHRLDTMRNWFDENEDDMSSEISWINLEDIANEVRDIQYGVEIEIVELKKLLGQS